jgi:superfamily II DNA/RNA helicase
MHIRVRVCVVQIIDADNQSKRALLVALLDGTTDGFAVVFAETKGEVRALERFLAQAGFSVASLHGDKTQPVRGR